MTTHEYEEIDPEEYRHMEHPLNIPTDPLAAERLDLMRKYRFDAEISPLFDKIGREIVSEFRTVPNRGFGGVNRLDEERNQIFVGAAITARPPSADQAAGIPREMTCKQGACSTLITRRPVKGRTALVFNDLLDFPLFASNDMVTVFGMRTYLGALIMPPEGVALGTVFWVDEEPRRWQRPEIDFMKRQADKVMGILSARRTS